MDNKRCDMCGNDEFQLIDGILTCTACGTKYPEIKNEQIKNEDISLEKLREEEITRLTNSLHKKQDFTFNGIILTVIFFIILICGFGGQYAWWAIFLLVFIIFLIYSFIFYFKKSNNQNLEPKTGILTDDEILRYTPYSKTSKSIRWERNGGFKVFLKQYWIIWVLCIILFIPSIFSLFLFILVPPLWAYDDFVKRKY
jgi:hypothetical protein